MRRRRIVAILSVVALCAAGLAAGPPAAAVPAAPVGPGHHPDPGGGCTDGPGSHCEGDQHGPTAGHLPASRKNVQLVGKAPVHNPGDNRVADVGVLGNYAYEAAFRSPTCEGGVYVFDIHNLRAPRQVAFLPASTGSYVGEGIQALHLKTAAYEGDVLLYNNEICADNPAAVGGATLVDINDPTHPVVLANGFGAPNRRTAHSAFLWTSHDRAYVVLPDSLTGQLAIADVTDPRSPKLILDLNVPTAFPQILQPGVGLDSVFFHDVVVRRHGNRQIMLLSHWDAGYVLLDVTDPVHPRYVADSDFSIPDPELKRQTGVSLTPEGNGHQAEFTHNGKYIIATDEDFGPTRLQVTTDDGGAASGAQGGDVQLGPGQRLTGRAVHVGLACTVGSVPAPPATGGPFVAVIERGGCTFTEKAAAVEAVTTNGGYAGSVVFNRTGGGGCSGIVSPSVEAHKPFLFVNRKAGLGFFDADAGYDDAACLALPPDGSVGRGPVPIGTTGDVVTFTAQFDGWGYVHLFAAGHGKLRELDTYAIPEAMDPKHAAGSGALSVHEVATSAQDPHLAYLSYYAGGFRVVKIKHNKLVEVGHFIDQGGNDFWGVQVFERHGVEYVLASDRDFGLYIFRYTGP